MAEVRIKFGGDSVGFEVAANRVKRRAEQLAREVGVSGGSLSRAIGGAAGGIISVSAARDVIRFASNINDLAAATSESTDRLQELNYAATQNGSDIQTMAKAMRQLSEARKAAMENPAGDEAAAFTGLGIGQEELAGLKTGSDLLYRVGDAVKAINIDANSLPLILELIGTRNQAVLPAMKAGLRESGEEAKRLNLILETDTVQALDKVGDALDRSLLGIKGPMAEVVLFFSRAIDTIISGVLAIPSLVSLNFNFMRLKVFEVLNDIDRVIRDSAVGRLGNKLDKMSGGESPQPGHMFDQHVIRAKVELDAAKNEYGKIFNGLLDRYDPKKGAKTKSIADVLLPDPKENPHSKTKDVSAEADKIARLQDRLRDAQIGLLDGDERRIALAQKIYDLERAILQSRLTQTNGQPFNEAKTLEQEIELFQTRRELNQLEKPDTERTPVADERARIGGLIGSAVGGPVDIGNIQRQMLTEQQKANEIAERVHEAIKQLKPTFSGGTTFDPYAA